MLSRLSIQWKITLLAGLCLLAIVTLLVGASLYQSTHSAALVKTSSSSMLEDSARLRMAARGELQGIRIQRYFMDAYQYGKGFSRQVLFLKDQAEKRFLDAFDPHHICNHSDTQGRYRYSRQPAVMRWRRRASRPARPFSRASSVSRLLRRA